MKRVASGLCLLLLLAGSHSLFSQSPVSTPLTLGEQWTLESEILGESRILNVMLPHGFHPDSAYPLIYVLDGSLHEDIIHLAGLVQFFRLQFQMPPAILIGIANVDRQRDFTFPSSLPELQEKYPTTGHSEAFIHFLAEEVKPFIRQQYRGNGAEYLIGQSLGGLLATEILLTKPELFTHYFIISPSVWWDNESLLDRAPALLAEQKQQPGRFVYLSVGKQEHPIMKRGARKLRGLLEKHSTPELHFLLMKEENHATILHRSIYEGLLLLYPVLE